RDKPGRRMDRNRGPEGPRFHGRDNPQTRASAFGSAWFAVGVSMETAGLGSATGPTNASGGGRPLPDELIKSPLQLPLQVHVLGMIEQDPHESVHRIPFRNIASQPDQETHHSMLDLVDEAHARRVDQALLTDGVGVANQNGQSVP